MKNIHTISTDEPSRLYKINNTGEFDLSKSRIPNVEGSINHYMYITVEGEIKEGDWFINKSRFSFVDKCICKGKGSRVEWNTEITQESLQKIILTTDPKLIDAGVQYINDEFLNWFLLNSRCEYVDINVEKEVKGNYLDCFHTQGKCNCGLKPCRQINYTYKIIIPQKDICPICEGTGKEVTSTTISRFKTCECMSLPQEESKLCDGQLRSLSMIDEKTEEYECIKCCQKYRYSGTHINRNAFSLTKCNNVKETIMDKFSKLVSDEKSTWVEDLEYYNENKEELDAKFEAELNDLNTEQESLEEAAKNYTEIFSLNGGHRGYAGQGFIDGAKWQAERMYSEEEVLSILNKHRTHLYTIKSQSDNEWFEQFKRK